MIRQYKAFGAAKVSFHMNGQQNVDFVDETHATGTCYAVARRRKETLVPKVSRRTS